MEWLIKFSASEGTRFFWQEGRKLFRAKPLDLEHASEQILKQIDPLVQAMMADEGSTPAFIEHAKLALSFWDRLVAHRLTPAAATRVRNVPLASFPSKVPLFLKHPWLVEVQKPLEGERLYGDTTALGCYPLDEDGLWMLIGWRIADGEPRVRAVYWSQRWTPGPKQMPELADAGYEWRDGAWAEVQRMPADEFIERRDWFQEGVRFATVLGALLEADNTFLRTHDTVPKAARNMRSGRQIAKPPGWVVRHVTLDSSEAEHSPASAKGTGGPLPIERLSLTDVTVREHVRLQRCGTGNQEQKWVRIKAHVSHRWTSSNPKRIIVDSK